MTGRRLVDLANETVSIADACRLIGMYVDADDLIRSRKMRCPFGSVYHSDGGVEPSFRLYPETNHAFCFARCGRFTPVWLLAQAWDIPTVEAAVKLLDAVGHKPATLAEAWKTAAHPPPSRPDPALLAEALKTFCQRICPDWIDAQFEPAVAQWLSRCLDVLDLVSTDAQAAEWLHGCKTVMENALRARSGIHNPSPPVHSQ